MTQGVGDSGRQDGRDVTQGEGDSGRQDGRHVTQGEGDSGRQDGRDVTHSEGDSEVRQAGHNAGDRDHSCTDCGSDDCT